MMKAFRLEVHRSRYMSEDYHNYKLFLVDFVNGEMNQSEITVFLPKDFLPKTN